MRCICKQVGSGVTGVYFTIPFTDSFAEFVYGNIESQPVASFSSSSHKNGESLLVLMRSLPFVIWKLLTPRKSNKCCKFWHVKLSEIRWKHLCPQHILYIHITLGFKPIYSSSYPNFAPTPSLTREPSRWTIEVWQRVRAESPPTLPAAQGRPACLSLQGVGRAADPSGWRWQGGEKFHRSTDGQENPTANCWHQRLRH